MLAVASLHFQTLTLRAVAGHDVPGPAGQREAAQASGDKQIASKVAVVSLSLGTCPPCRLQQGVVIQKQQAKRRDCAGLLDVADSKVAVASLSAGTCPLCRLQQGVVIQKQQTKEKLHIADNKVAVTSRFAEACPACRLQQGVVIQKQQAKEKLHKLVAPLLAMHNAHQLSLQALGAITPKLNLSFSEVGATLKDGTIILQGVTGHFNNAKVCCRPELQCSTVSGALWSFGSALAMLGPQRCGVAIPLAAVSLKVGWQESVSKRTFAQSCRRVPFLYMLTQATSHSAPVSLPCSSNA